MRWFFWSFIRAFALLRTWSLGACSLAAGYLCPHSCCACKQHYAQLCAVPLQHGLAVLPYYTTLFLEPVTAC